MLTIAKLFGKSPFAPLQTHMDKVARCVGELPALFKAVVEQDALAIERLATLISQLEHEADLTKTDIRNHLPRSVFLPVDRGALFEILALQDAFADQAEIIARHASLRVLPIFTSVLQEEFSALFRKSIEAFWLARKVIQEIEQLIESSFGGIEAQKVKGMIEQIAFAEYETALIHHHLLKHLYQTADQMPHPLFHLFLTLIEEISGLARLAEQLGHRVYLLLELK